MNTVANIGLSDFDRKQVMLDGARTQLGNCRRCSLCHSRRNIVFGGGNADAPVMLVGGNVGWEEDLSGRVLDGDRGGLVAYALHRLGLDVQRDVYATTVLKCLRPHTIKDGEKTRADPTPAQVAACAKYLRLQVSIVKPAILVAHGKLAAETLFGERRSHVAYCGSWRRMGKTTIALATHDPAGLTFGERMDLQPAFLEAYDELAVRLDCLGRIWKPNAACFTAGWQYRGAIQ